MLSIYFGCDLVWDTVFLRGCHYCFCLHFVYCMRSWDF